MTFALLTLLGCPKPVETAPAYGSHVAVELPAGAASSLPERERLLLVLDQAAPRAQTCYEAALTEDPLLYGDALVVLQLHEDGQVEDVELTLSTLGSAQMDDCLLDVLRGLEFPSGGVSLRYPFVFTSSLTPPEITRTLMLKHGLIDLDAEALELDNAARDERNRKGQDERGWTETW
ncbi:MAG: AgmX/PglI C-terminal domain-containing protein [Proteobacteria bacterium]|nr:AgmX/PglI C-terminal domain-containing protein [Pseudomonadota bacterium]MCP4921952.1 AgmX/PglI C-terminal domain-containing protein [Pseudomonadota bacterium]